MLFLLRTVCSRHKYVEALATENGLRQQADSMNHLLGFADEDQPEERNLVLFIVKPCNSIL